MNGTAQRLNPLGRGFIRRGIKKGMLRRLIGASVGLFGLACVGFGLAGDPPVASIPRPLMHDPSTVIQAGAEYWVFGTGQGIASLHSRNLVAWERGPRVFETPPVWIADVVPGNKGHLWAPDVMFSQGRYLLYYSISLWGKNNSVIALATNAALDPAARDYSWRDEGPVIRSAPGNDFNAIDPCLVRDRKGGLWMGFGSFWGGIRLVELDPASGKRRVPNGELYSIAFHESIEAPYLCWRAPYHYLFVNWGACCRGTNSTYEIRVGRSSEVTGPYVDKGGVDMMRGGGTPVVGSRWPHVGPGHLSLFEAGGRPMASVHYYDAENGGRGTLGILRVSWDTEGWPELAWDQPGPRVVR